MAPDPSWIDSERAIGGNRRGGLPVKTRGIMFGDLVPIPTDPTLDRPPKRCYNCWQEGHSCLRCPRAPSVYCHNCGRRGADLTVCPRCCVAHQAYIQERNGRRGARPSSSRRRSGGATAAADRVTNLRTPEVAAAVALPPPRLRRPREEVSAPPRGRSPDARVPPPGVPTMAVASVALVTCGTGPSGAEPADRRPAARRSETPGGQAVEPPLGPTVTEALRLVEQLSDLPVEVRSAVLLRVFGRRNLERERER